MLKLGIAIISAAMLAACASAGVVYTPRPFPVPGGSPGTGTGEAPGVAVPPRTPPTAPVTPARPVPGPIAPDGYALSGTALSLRGAPYRDGGADPNGFDCSGFVQYVFGQNGLSVPRAVREQFRLGQRVDRQKLEPGDLVFFSTVAPGPSHVGISVGGDQFVHAPSERGVVRVERLGTPYWTARYVGARRVN